MKIAKIVAAVAVLVACGSAQAVTYNETFTLTGSGANPPTNATGFGAANVSVDVDTATHTLTWDVLFTGLSGPLTGAEFRNGTTPVVNIGAISGLTGPELKGSADVTAAQTNDIVAGQWFITLDTAANPNGEIGGMLPTMQSMAAVPEPASMSLVVLGVGALAVRFRRRNGRGV